MCTLYVLTIITLTINSLKEPRENLDFMIYEIKNVEVRAAVSILELKLYPNRKVNVTSIITNFAKHFILFYVHNF